MEPVERKRSDAALFAESSRRLLTCTFISFSSSVGFSSEALDDDDITSSKHTPDPVVTFGSSTQLFAKFIVLGWKSLKSTFYLCGEFVAAYPWTVRLTIIGTVLHTLSRSS